jgi:tRNA (guanine9-N1)-methyltransferase
MNYKVDHAYIIGGLVDRTVLKNASLKRAQQLGIKAYRLPIANLMQNRKCLNLDHVSMLLCKFMETKDWNKSFEYAAPKRFKR